MKKLTRVKCPYCQKKVAVDKTGALSRHTAPWLLGNCPNSGRIYKADK